MRFAEARFALSTPDAMFPTKTRLTVLNDIVRQTGVVPKELRDLPRLPAALEYLWDWFTELDATRGQGFSADLAIAWQEINAFFAVQRVTPQRWELQALRRIDEAYLSSRARIAAGGGQVAAGAGALRDKITGAQ